MNEFELIQRAKEHFSAPCSSEVPLSIGDDAAVVRPGSKDVSISCDTMVEGVHFRTDWSSPEDVGHKLIESSVSDLCAMGARPWVLVLSVSAPQSTDEEWFEGLWSGIAQASKRSGIMVVGGDTTRSPKGITLTATVLGRHSDRYLTRAGARPGDRIYVTGDLGKSGLGLQVLLDGNVSRSADTEAVLQRHKRPLARVEWGNWLVTQPKVTSCLDVSDGLAQDLGHISRSSEVTAVLHTEKIPMSSEYLRLAERLGIESPWRFALSSGEEYELVFTADPAVLVPRELDGIPVTCIGFLKEETDVDVLYVCESGATPLPVDGEGWDHFS